MNVVDSSKSIIKSIIRAMNLSSELILKCLQEQISIARKRARATARVDKVARGERNAEDVGKKSKTPHSSTQSDGDDNDETSDEADKHATSAKRARKEGGDKGNYPRIVLGND